MTTLALWRCPQYSICQDKNEYHYHSVNCDKTLFLYFLDIKIYCDLVLQALHLNFFMVRWTIVWPNWTPYVGCQCEKILLAHITFIFNVFHFNAIEVRFSFLEIWVKKFLKVLTLKSAVFIGISARIKPQIQKLMFYQFKKLIWNIFKRFFCKQSTNFIQLTFSSSKKLHQNLTKTT